MGTWDDLTPLTTSSARTLAVVETMEHTTAVAVMAEAARAVAQERAFQKPDELGALADLLVGRLPAAPRILELGVGDGGTAWLWRQLWPEAEIIGVDVHRLAPCEGCTHGQAHNGCPNRRISRALSRKIHANSIHDRVYVLAQLEDERSLPRFDFLHIDGDHTLEGVTSDFETYHPLVREGGLTAIHDTLGYPSVARFCTRLEAVLPSQRIETEPASWGGYLVVLA